MDNQIIRPETTTPELVINPPAEAETTATETAAPLKAEEVPSNNGAPIADAPEKKEVIPKIEEFDVKENLVFDLTDAELLQISKTVAALSREKREKESHLKAYTSDRKDEIKGLDADIRFNIKLIEVGKQGRDTDCIMRKDYTRGIIQWIFNGKVMKERGLEAHERVRPQDNTISSVNQ